MSIEDTKAKIAVMQAAVDGKGIEFRVEGKDQWYLLDEGHCSASWNWAHFDYRVAPPKPREIWVITPSVGAAVIADSEDRAMKAATAVHGTYAKFVEVL